MKNLILCFLFLIAIVNAIEQAPAFHSPPLKSEVLGYWTKERMQKAKPMDLINVDFKPSSSKVKGTYSTSEVPEAEYDTAPYRKAGRFFFEVSPGRTASCSASSVKNSVVLTAGHCVSNGRGTLYRNLLYCPQYLKGECPKGRFVGESVVLSDDYHRRSQLGRDVAFVVVDLNEDGEELEDVVGGYDLRVNVGRNQTCVALGYPGNIGGGNLMIQSKGTQTNGHSYQRPPTVKFPSRMTFGSSGGPWSIDGKEVNSVVSYGNPRLDPNHFYGPYFDTTVKELYDEAVEQAKSTHKKKQKFFPRSK